MAYFLAPTKGQNITDCFVRIAIEQANINAEEIKSIKIPLPGLKTQQKVVDTLDKQYLQTFKQLKFVKHQAEEVKKKIIEGLFE